MSAASSLASSPCPTPASSHRGDGLGLGLGDVVATGGGTRTTNNSRRSLKRARQDDDHDGGDAQGGLYNVPGSRLSYARLEGYTDVVDAKYAEGEHEDDGAPVWLKNE